MRQLNHTTMGSSGRPSPGAGGYALAKAGISALSNLFALYYVDVFLHVHLLARGWFEAGQALYLLWNALNDPLFAWMLVRAGRHLSPTHMFVLVCSVWM